MDKYTLEELKADPKLCESLAGVSVVIRSRQWGAWWRENSAGYAADILNAGVYTFEDAYRVIRHCGPEKRIVIEPLSIYLDYIVSTKQKADAMLERMSHVHSR